MGITIFAKGKIDRIGDIPHLIDDLKRLAGEKTWKYQIMNDDFDSQPNPLLIRQDSKAPGAVIKGSLGLKGIILKIDPGTETFSILFDRSGVLTDVMQQLSWTESNGQNERFTICKTQFGNIDSHISIIEILDLLKRKYVNDLIVTDEGAYWETRDPRILAEKRIALGYYLRHTEKVISGIEISDDLARDPETIASAIEEALLKSQEEDKLE